MNERRWHPSHAHVHGSDSIARTFPERTRSEAMERMERLERSEAIERLELPGRNMGFGALAKVLEPVSLVKEIKDDLGKSLRSYAKP